MKEAEHDTTRLDTESERDPYPVTIVPTRYQGIYEALGDAPGKWSAFQYSPFTIAEFAEPFVDGLGWPSVASPFGGDVEAAHWWREHRDEVGLGDTPNDALTDLRAKMKAAEPA